MLPLFSVIAFSTASACGLYNSTAGSDSLRFVNRLATVSLLMYFLIAMAVSVARLVAHDPDHMWMFYVIGLGSSAGYFISALLIRREVFTYNFNGTVLERRVLVLGLDECAAKIEALHASSRSPYRVVGFVPFARESRSESINERKILPAEILEVPTGLVEQVRKLRADEIVVASRERRGLPVQALMECKLAGIPVTEFSSFWERQTGQIDLDELTPSWFIFSGGFRVSWIRSFAKRGFDILMALLVLTITLPITVLAAIAVKLDSPGPIFYKQERVGAGGRIFTILKFRSMRSDAEKDGVARWAQANDNRITRVGRFLRRSRIDEIPQLLNVLMGSMSFVGPRPERPMFVDNLQTKIPHYSIRHRVNPGITGWAQINYPYGASDEDAKAKLAFDLYYVKNWNIFLDALIMFQTARVVLWQEGAR
jgi:sugar transferase (PEP-CTERM system associated)